jgi:sugar phosphate isomerase/epimerase
VHANKCIFRDNPIYMITRKAFIQQAALVAAGMMLPASNLFSMSKLDKTKVGLQLYTLRDNLEKNAKETIEKVAKIGYAHVETFHKYVGPGNKELFWGMTPKEFKTLLSENHLVSHSGHYQVNDFLTVGNGKDEALKLQMDAAAEIGQQYFVVPVPPPALWDKMTADEYKFLAEQLNKAGIYAKQFNMKIGYHNHFFEFRQLANGKTGYDILLEGTDKATVYYELDLFWAVKSGIDPVSMFKKHPGRFPMWHVKDIDKAVTTTITGNGMDEKPTMDILKSVKFAEVGSGAIDFKKIFGAAQTAGLQYFFVEQDGIYMSDHFQSIKQSFDYIKDNLSKQ